MSENSNCGDFQDSIQKLKDLREELCTKQKIWKDAYKERTFVVGELQDLYTRLKEDGSAPEWCLEKAESILTELAALPNDQDKG